MARWRPRLAWLLLPLAMAVAAPESSASGPYGDELAKCLVRSTNEADRALLVKWMFAMLSAHPQVSGLATVTEERRRELNRSMARLVERLLTESCVTEAREAIRYEGTGTIEYAFSVLGQVAGRELMTHPDVAAGMAGVGESLDAERLNEALGLGEEER